jgi:hypothetical protein
MLFVCIYLAVSFVCTILYLRDKLKAKKIPPKPKMETFDKDSKCPYCGRFADYVVMKKEFN